MVVTGGADEDPQVAISAHDHCRFGVTGRGEQQGQLRLACGAAEFPGVIQMPGRPAAEFPPRDTGDHITAVTGPAYELLQRRAQGRGQHLAEREVDQRLDGERARLGQIPFLISEQE
jgi:hypothetical protein